MKKISAIIVNYCTKSLIEKSISNLLSAYENCEVIFVDNDSPDGSADLVQEKFGDNPKVTLIKTGNNGLAAGCNVGLAKASGDYVLYIGTDAFPSGEVLSGLVDYMDKNPEVGIATARLFYRDGTADIDPHRGFPTPWVSLTHLLYLDRLFPKSKYFSGYFMGYLDFNRVLEIDVCISHFMFVRPEVHKKIGNWDESFWLYGEDIDYCYRAKQAGFKVMYMGTMPVLHYKGASVGRTSASDIPSAANVLDKTLPGSEKAKLQLRLRLARESTHAMKTFYKKHLMKKYPAPLNWLVLFGIWVNEQLRVGGVLLKNYL